MSNSNIGSNLGRQMSPYQEVIDYIFSLTVSGVKLELSRVEAFMAELGNPFEAFPSIHVAGTNGKGSTSAMLASVLEATGLKVGLFTSPHLLRPNERIKINGEEIPDESIIDLVTQWKSQIATHGITFFEVLTALAFCYFREHSVDIAVIETGLGGRLDATNVINPILSVITSVDMDHMNILGDTLDLIAREKAGIIKPGVPVVLAENLQIVHEVIRDRANLMSSDFIYTPDECEVTQQEIRFPRQLLTCRSGQNEYVIDSPLLGNHQSQNVALVLTALRYLPFEVSAPAILAGLGMVNWPGRMQVVQMEPPVVYDVAHNPAGVRQLLQSLQYAGFGEAVLLVGLNQRKDTAGIIECMRDWPGEIGLFSFAGDSSIPVKILLELQQSNRHITAVFENYNDGIVWAEMIRDHGDRPAICIFGSHYLAEDIFSYYQVD